MDVPLIPRDVLFGNPTRSSPQVSPDGTRLAYLAPDAGVLNVWVRTLGAHDDHPVTADRERGVRSYRWAHDDRHLLYLQDRGGDEDWHLHRVDPATGEAADLTPFEGVRAEVVEHDRRHPHDVLVGLNRDNPQLHDVYRLDLRTGVMAKVADNPGVVGWVADADLVVRAAVAPRSDGGVTVVVRDGVDDGWRPLHDVGPDDALTTFPLGFDLEGRRLLAVSSVDANTGRLGHLDLATGSFDVLAEDPGHDVSATIVHPELRRPQAVAFARERLHWEVLDPAVGDDLARLGDLHPGDPQLLGRDHADRTWLVGYTTDDGPVPYYAWDRHHRQATFLFVHRPELEGAPLAPMEPFSFPARDGLTIHGYLTFPPGVPRRGLPAVLNVHGGPWARNSWGFDPEAQWLANRGYLCVQVNYRGSTGYGKAFVNAGDREWGARMHDDLLDAVDHVVGRGWADPARVAVYGASYGGYAALVGAAFTPDRFACAVDVVGPSNLRTLIQSIPPYWAPMVSLFHRRLGDPATEPDFLWSRSPLSRAGEIRIPLLIAQGANDPRVKRAESEQIVGALRDKGIPHEYLLFEDEGHGFAKPGNRLRFYAAAEAFLARHLGGRAEH